MYKVCIFDLDGTLADSVESIAYSANRAIEAVGLKGNPVEDYKRFAGDGADEMLKRSLIQSGDKNLVHFAEVKKNYAELFKKDYLYHVLPYEGIDDVLKKLKEMDFRLAVLSNKPHERTKDVVGDLFGDVFDIVQGQQEGIERKPSPMGALKIAEDFSVLSWECIYVGDTDTDMQTGKAAGMLTVGVTWGFRGREELEKNNADIIIDNPYELIDIVRGFKKQTKGHL